MSDPLSIAASIAGLLALSGKIYTSLSGIVARTAEAPKSAYMLLLTVSEMRISLSSVSDLINSFLNIPLGRRAMVRVDHLILCLTQTVFTFSELGEQLGKWPEDVHLSLWKRLRWSAMEGRLMTLNAKIQEHKTSLGLVLNILQCESDLEAQRSRESLSLMMQRVLDENGDLRAQISQIGSRLPRSTLPSLGSQAAESGHTGAGNCLADIPHDHGTGSIGIIPPKPSSLSVAYSDMEPSDDLEDDGASTIREGKGKMPDTGHQITTTEEDIADPGPLLQAPLTASTRSVSDPKISSGYPIPIPEGNSFAPPFETILQCSRVYARVEHKDVCDASYTTNHSISRVWTMLSGLSLSQVSNISVLALPISASDILQSWWYRTYMLVEPAEAMYKIAILGDAMVGKSALAIAFCDDVYLEMANPGPDPTVEDRHYKRIKLDDSACRIEIIDTAPSFTDYEILIDAAVREADGFVIAYSVADPRSFGLVQQLYNRIVNVKGPSWETSSPGSVVLVGTKSDVPGSRRVTRFEAQTRAKSLRCRSFECSAKSGDGVAAPFVELARALRLMTSYSEQQEVIQAPPSPSFRTRAQSMLSGRPVVNNAATMVLSDIHSVRSNPV